MRYLVTGGCGFLGTNLCLALSAGGGSVVALDDFSTSFAPNRALLGERQVEIVRHDVIEGFPDLGKFDFIYNLACAASPKQYRKDPLRTLRTSLWGGWNALECARRSDAGLLQASTSEVYGDPLESPQKEDYRGNVDTTGPRACYDEGKRAAETMMEEYAARHGLKVKIARIFNTYGPGMDPEDGRVVSNFIVQALEGRPLTIYGDGSQTRSFCYVDDLIRALRLLEKSAAKGPMNLGNPEECTISSLVLSLEKVLGRKLEREYLPLPKDDPRKRRPDISMARKKLGWNPETGLEEGLGMSVRYFGGLGK